MRKSWIKLSFALMGAFVILGQASAQSSVSFWFNSVGDSSSNQPAVINVTSGSPYALNVYYRSASVGPLSAVSLMFGYSTATTTGASATPLSTDATYNNWAWSTSDLTNNQVFSGDGGGGGPANGTTRPYGRWLNSLNLSNTFSGTGDNVDFLLGTITLNINAAPGADIPVSVWSFGQTDNYASAVANGNNVEFFPSAPYNATLHVVGVPEPASIALLGLGVAALLRRRRK